MPVTTLSPFNDAACRLPPGSSVQGFDRGRQPQGILVAYAIALILLAPCTTSALELGEATIKSGLGQSLVVEIPYRLAGDERVTSACVGLAPAGPAADALPTYASVSRISVTPTHIEIFDERRVLEPLIGLSVDVHCNDAPHFVRSYQLFVDPPAQIPTTLSNRTEVAAAGRQSAIDAAAPIAAGPRDATSVIPNETATIPATTDPTASAAIVRTARANASPRARGLVGGNLPQGQTYRVVRGDTLSGIAARIAGRPLTISQAADAIFAANPTAFTRGNPDLIEEGRSITIPNMTPSDALAAPSTPVPPPVELPTAAPVATANPAPAPQGAAQPLPADDAASVAAQDARQPLPAAAPVVAPPSAAPAAEPPRTDAAPEAPGPAAPGRLSAWFIALLAVVGLLLLSVPWAFVRRRRKQQAAAQASTKVQEPLRRRPVELASRMHVVEGSLTGTHAARQTAALNTAAIPPVTDSAAALPPYLKDLALNRGPTDAVDFNVGAPVATNEHVDESARAYVIDARDDTMEESAPTTRMPDIAAEETIDQQPRSATPDRSEQTIDDEKMTLTIVELDMLRQDYEAEHTLTQQSSEALRDALADLAATKKAHAATAETATLESPQMSPAETNDAEADAQTARVRVK